jgi:hypothetical protein
MVNFRQDQQDLRDNILYSAFPDERLNNQSACSGKSMPLTLISAIIYQ